MNHLSVSSAVAKILTNKRDAERVKSTFSAGIYTEGEFYCHCIIRDVSNTGMKLEFQDNFELPQEFEVKTPAMPEMLTVRKAWQKKRDMGVTFVKMAEETDDEQLAS